MFAGALFDGIRICPFSQTYIGSGISEIYENPLCIGSLREASLKMIYSQGTHCEVQVSAIRSMSTSINHSIWLRSGVKALKRLKLPAVRRCSTSYTPCRSSSSWCPAHGIGWPTFDPDSGLLYATSQLESGQPYSARARALYGAGTLCTAADSTGHLQRCCLWSSCVAHGASTSEYGLLCATVRALMLLLQAQKQVQTKRRCQVSMVGMWDSVCKGKVIYRSWVWQDLCTWSQRGCRLLAGVALYSLLPVDY